MNAVQLIAARKEAIGRDATIKVIWAWAREFFDGFDSPIVDSNGDVQVINDYLHFKIELGDSRVLASCAMRDDKRDEWASLKVIYAATYASTPAAKMVSDITTKFTNVINSAEAT